MPADSGIFYGLIIAFASALGVAFSVSVFLPTTTGFIRVGKKPEFITPEEEIVCRYVHELVHTHQVSDDAYAAAWKLLGTRTLVDLTVLIGHCTSVSMTLNPHRVPLPKRVKPRLLESTHNP